MKKENLFQKITLLTISMGIWVLVMQNAGIISSNQNVNVVNTVGVDGSVEVNGSVSINDEVEVNLTKINGWQAANYYKYKLDGEEYHALGTE